MIHEKNLKLKISWHCPLKRRSSRHDCLPSLLVDGEQFTWNCVRRRKKYFVLGWLAQPRQEKNLLYLNDVPNEQIKKGPLSYVPHLPQFQQSAGATPLLSLCFISVQCCGLDWIRISIEPTKTEKKINIFWKAWKFFCRKQKASCVLGSPSRRLRTNTDYKYCIFSIVKFSIFNYQKLGSPKVWFR